MKNKLRYYIPLKKIFACCTLAFLLFSVSVPCFARGVYPTESNTFAGQQKFDTLNVQNGWNYVNKFAVTEIVQKAYQLNYFGGGVPVAIVELRGARSFGVLTVPYTNITETETPFGGDYSGIEPPTKGTLRADVVGNLALSGSGSYAITAINSVSGVDYPMVFYLINQDYTFYPSYVTPTLVNYDSTNPQFSDFVLSLGMHNVYTTVKSYVIAYREGEGDWRIVNQYDSEEMPTADIVDEQLEVINDWYDDQLSGGTYNQIFQYELDIPSIITAIPNGAKQIINNAFGFEIFGVNVAGLLSVLLIVTIIAFVVKWLMSR